MDCCSADACYWACFDYVRRLMRGGWGESKPVTEAVRKKASNGQRSQAPCDARSMLLRIDPSRPFTKDYKTKNFIGQGSFGAVYEVKHKRTDDMRCSKEILMRDIEDMEYAQTELEAMIRLDHPNVLKLYEYFEDNVAIYLICEYCKGGDFSQLGDPEVPLDEIRLLFRDVIAALSYCHNQNVAHRDLKMENCLIHTAPNMRKVGKVIDFGLASIRRQGDKGQWMNEILGTRYYVAPEIIDKGVKYGVGCDIWAVGVMLFITVTDQHPCAQDGFNLKTPQLWRRIVSKEPIRTQPLKDAKVSQCLRHLLLGLLEKDKDRRPTAQEVLEHEWFQTLSTGQSLRGSWGMSATPSAASKGQLTRGSKTDSIGSIDSQASNDAVLRRAITYRQASHFEKAILTIASYQEASAEIESLKQIFLDLDTAGNGTLSKQELSQGIKRAGLRMTDVEVEGLFAALDADRTGKVHFTEWLAGTIHPREIASDKAVSDVFDFFDIDRTGRVSRDELCQVLGDEASAASLLQAANVQGRSYLTKADLARVMQEVARSMHARQSEFLRA